jgi:glutamate/tyrosine decarboxylase-like PLP-dependent enzyme
VGEHGTPLLLASSERATLWSDLVRAIEAYIGDVAGLPLTPTASRDEIARLVAQFDFAVPKAPSEALAAAVGAMRAAQVHTAHPRYFGLFNPAPTTMGIAADALVAALNPQLAAESHAPFAVAAERHLLRAFATRFGFPDDAEGTFASGGAEANVAAILLALVRASPEFARRGARALSGDAVVYASAEAHHSLEKGARMCGLGSDAVRRVGVDRDLRMDPGRLRDAITSDRRAGRLPVMIVATLGTTNAGAIDPVASVAEVAAKERLWLHADAAWGGLAAIVTELRASIAGVERADSITFDAHKSLGVPMGAGMLITRHAGALAAAYGVHADYMPSGSTRDPFAESPQWSRRFIGLKLLLSLAVAGWSGYETTLAREVELGRRLRRKLVESGWRLVNETPLPIACFVDARRDDGDSGRFLTAVAKGVAPRAWISVTRVAGGRRALRACITSARTEEADVDALIELLADARRSA